MRPQEDDRLHALVVLSALVVLAIVVWAGGRRLYGRWAAGRGAVPSAAVSGPRRDDGVDRPPSFIPPLALVGVKPNARPPKSPKPKPPAAVPMPPITPDKE